MGGALAVKVAAEEKALPALVLLAPYLTMPALMRRAAASSAMWGSLCPYFASGGSRSIHDSVAAARGLGHGVFTPAALRALYDVVVAGDNALPDVKAPTLMIQSREDNRISIEGGQRTFDLLGSAEKQLVWTNGAGHVITVDFGHEKVFELTGEWLDRHLRRSVGSKSNEGSVG
jgi:carboxylesterase